MAHRLIDAQLRTGLPAPHELDPVDPIGLTGTNRERLIQPP